MKPTANQQRRIDEAIRDYIDNEQINIGICQHAIDSDHDGARDYLRETVNSCMEEIKASTIVPAILWFFVQWWIKRKIIQIIEGM